MISFEKKVTPLIESIYDTLTPNEKTIAQYFLKQSSAEESLSARAVSERLFVSIPSLTRFAQKCGYKGYRQFIYDFQESKKEGEVIHNDLTKTVLSDYEELLSKSFSLIDESQVIKVCGLLNNAKRVYIYGQGSSGLAAHEMKFRFMRLGMICEAITDLHTMLMNRVLVDEQCLVIGISVSANASVVEAVRQAKKQGAKTVLITSKRSEESEKVCDELVLIAPAKTAVNSVDIAKGEWIKGLKDSYLSVGDPAHVPAGQYAEESLTKLNLWDQVKDKLARAKDVRGALALVERAEAPYGIVYSTDAKVSNSVKTVGVFPKDSYKPVEYPVAILKDHDNADTRDFLNYLESSAAKKIFVEYGFSVK